MTAGTAQHSHSSEAATVLLLLLLLLHCLQQSLLGRVLQKQTKG
jgi:hypothetical protein